MTGYGRGSAPLGSGSVLVEIRSVNHRYLDLRTRVAPELSELTPWLEQYVRKQLQRGRYDLSIRSEGLTAPEPRIAPERARAVFRQLAELAAQLGAERPHTVEWLAALPGVVEPSASMNDSARQALERATSEALEDLSKMRASEGAALERDLRARLTEARRLTVALGQRVPQLVEDYRQRLAQRLARLLDGDSARLDPSRLEQEVALLADKSDVNEELVRLESHFQQFERFLSLNESVGRRLDFLLQEIGREINTIGSKCQDAEAAHMVVDLKGEIERLREQVQNVE
ncbi:MAG: YicC/YloC family endoribonuclease [Polyangiaceae bacterium]